MGKLFKEFKEFALKGNIVDMAIGIIIGGAFSAIVNSLVADIITPVIGAIFGQPDFSAIAPGGIPVGNFINAVISFLIIALCLFAVVKAINSMKKPVEEGPAPRVCPFCKSEIADDATRCPHCTSQL